MNEERPAHRQRMRIACESCRERKRKCDGERPCVLCRGYGYACSYRSTPRGRDTRRGTAGRTRITLSKERLPSNPPTETTPQQMEMQQQQSVQVHHLNQQRSPELRGQEQSGSLDYCRSIESNSGAAFARLLTMTLEPSNGAKSPMRMLAWNLFLGERQIAIDVQPEAITDIFSEPEMQNLAMIYLRKVHPCYGFVDEDLLFRSITSSWHGLNKSSAQDALLCGVAGLALLFTNIRSSTNELSVVALAKRLLDPSLAGFPSLQSATAWLLRTVYLRLASKPEEAWLSSCNTLHIIDAAGLISDAGHASAFSLPQDPQSVHIRWRVFGVAQHLNMWMSYDLGRSRVLLPNIGTPPTSLQAGDYTMELLDLLPYSEALDPANGHSAESLTATLMEVLDRVHTEPPSVLAQCNVMLCIYRRLHSFKLEVLEDIMNQVFNLIQKSFQAVRSAIAAGLPWHHVANIPFQTICTLLAIDSPQSFALLAESLECIVAANDVYQTEATREAASAAHTLLQLHRKRRETEVQKHSDMLSLYPSVHLVLQDSHNDPLNEYGLLDSWWFSEFMAHSEFSLGNMTHS